MKSTLLQTLRWILIALLSAFLCYWVQGGVTGLINVFSRGATNPFSFVTAALTFSSLGLSPHFPPL
jgi:hypothetical protein